MFQLQQDMCMSASPGVSSVSYAPSLSCVGGQKQYLHGFQAQPWFQIILCWFFATLTSPAHLLVKYTFLNKLFSAGGWPSQDRTQEVGVERSAENQGTQCRVCPRRGR